MWALYYLPNKQKIVAFLDVRFNLNDQTYEPYRKPNNEPLYVNKQSNLIFQKLYLST